MANKRVNTTLGASPLTLLSALALLGCDVPIDPEIADKTRPIAGGMVDQYDPAVVLVSAAWSMCTGTLVSETVVLTAAHCVDHQVRAVYFGTDYSSFVAEREVVDQIPERSYTSVGNGADLALLRLAEPAPIEIPPIPINLEPFDESFVGGEVRTIGFGVSDGDTGEGAGTKRQATMVVREVSTEHLWIGNANTYICNGDSGGPSMVRRDGVEYVAAVTSFGFKGCEGAGAVARVDTYSSFVLQVIDAWSGPCQADGSCVTEGCRTPDPDCDPCGFEGTCATGCETMDLDCPIAGFDGDPCETREDCESLLCVEAPEDPRVTYCSEECDPEKPEEIYGCLPPLTVCAADPDGRYLCRFPGITPGVQGYPCTEQDQCRSGYCFPPGDGICAEECGGSFGECDEAYVCENIGAGIDACILPEDEGCCLAQVARPRPRPPLGGILLAGLGLVLLVLRKRRIALHNRAQN